MQTAPLLRQDDDGAQLRPDAPHDPARLPQRGLRTGRRAGDAPDRRTGPAPARQPPYRRRKPPALRPLPRRRRRGDPSPYGLHGNRLQTHRPGEFHRRRFRIRPTAPQHHLVPLRTAPSAGRHPHLPARRRRRTARPRRRNDVFLLAKPADRRPAGPDSRRRRHPGQPGERRDEAAVRLETRLPRSPGHHARNSASARATG